MHILVKISIVCMSLVSAFQAFPQVQNAGEVRRATNLNDKKQTSQEGLTPRMLESLESAQTHDADLSYQRQIYRSLDLSKAPNAPLYFPEDVIDGKENLFRIIFSRVLDGSVPAFEYLDGREIFSDQYRVNIADMLERFDIYATPAKGSTERNPKFAIDEADVPAQQVLNYYIIEKWEFDTRTNRMKTRVEAICPVLSRSGDFGDLTRYPMFWVRMDALRPYLMQQYVFTSDDNNLARYSLDDYFSMGLYDGEIYKTQNMRNLSMAQMFPDEDTRKQAQDSIDNRLHTYGKNLWVPSREEYLAMREKEAAATESDTIPERTIVSAKTGKDDSARARKRTSSRKAKTSDGLKSGSSRSNRKAKVNASTPNSAAEKSVRRRKR